jgi:hypothetical protein
MDTLQQYIKEAENAVGIAHHLITKTFPLSQDPKILLSILKNIRISHENILLAVLDNPFLRPKISRSASFIVKFDRFKDLMITKSLLTPSEFVVIQLVEDDWNTHASSDVEFARKQKLIMADNNYQLKQLTPEKITQYISQTQIILKKLFNSKK